MMKRNRFLAKLTQKKSGINPYKHGRWFINAIRVVIIIDLFAVLFSSFRGLDELNIIFNIIYYFAASVFLIEYICRIINAAKNHLCKRYIFSFMGIIDFISIFPFLLPLFTGDMPDMVALVSFSKVFTIFKLMRYSKAFKTLADILFSVRTQLELVLAVSGSFMFFAAIMMYYVERNAQPEIFSSIGQGLWWAVITMTTVGYGDIYPITPLGKFLAGFIALIGMGMIALPAGIISSAVNKHTPESQQGSFCPHCGKLHKEAIDQHKHDNQENTPENLAK